MPSVSFAVKALPAAFQAAFGVFRAAGRGRREKASAMSVCERRRGELELTEGSRLGRAGRRFLLGKAVCPLLLVAAAGCGAGGVLTAPLGGTTAGARGNVRVLFINNTPHEAVFTAGVFDPTDVESAPQVVQFAGEDGSPALPAGGQSTMIELPCARAFAVGAAGFIEQIRTIGADAQLESAGLVEGVQFNVEGDAADESDIAQGRLYLLGPDFTCNAMLIVRLEFSERSDPAFTIDFSVIPSESQR